MKEKMKTNIKSSEKLSNFLDKNDLHKKDFAEMIGVTLSYVYNLIDNTIPFSTRGTTLERIATVMEVAPEEFEEYRIPQEPILLDESVDILKSSLKRKKISVVNFLKAFPRKKRIDIVDILRGALPMPLDYKELSAIGKIAGLSSDKVYSIWEDRLRHVLETNGMNIYSNSELVNSMLECAKKHLLV
ncbi:MAG: helix-turn-helix domain-containing protein [Candidatus Gastranaerophilaceae bacterium]